MLPHTLSSPYGGLSQQPKCLDFMWVQYRDSATSMPSDCLRQHPVGRHCGPANKRPAREVTDHGLSLHKHPAQSWLEWGASETPAHLCLLELAGQLAVGLLQELGLGCLLLLLLSFRSLVCSFLGSCCLLTS